VSLPSDIIQLFGTSGVPAIVAGSVFSFSSWASGSHLNELRMLFRSGLSHSTFKKQKHSLTALKSSLSGFLVSVTFR
jgi:hypothetical protein